MKFITTILLALYTALPFELQVPEPEFKFDDVSVSHRILNDKYDYEFKKYWDLWNPPVPIMDSWKLLKAQCYAESSFNPKAISPVGAKGICQFMPATWAEMGTGMDVFDADANINSASRYMYKLMKGWSSERPIEDKFRLAQASYNAGFGNLLKSQKKCPSNLYNDIIVCLPLVTGKHSLETITYVKRIWKGYYMLLL